MLHVDFTSIEETVPLKEEPVIWNVLVLQDHFSKYVVAYVMKDHTAHTAAETLRNGYFGLFGVPAYLVSDQGKTFMGRIIIHLCDLYGVQKLRTSRCLTSEEAAKQCHYYDRKAGAVALQPGDIVMVCTDGFVGKQKVKDQWEDGDFIIESQLEDWLVYKVKCLTSDDRRKPKYQILHQNHLLVVTNEDAFNIPGQAQAEVTPTVSNATPEAFSAGIGLLERLQPSLVT